MLTISDRRAYLDRLGITEVPAPTLANLILLQQAHVERIPWQTVDIYTGRPASMDVRESIQLIVGQRSGYCFQLNGAFSTLLTDLGYEVMWHKAGVQPMGQEPRINGFHLGLTVRLAGESGESETYLVDAGLGDMPYEPIPLKFGSYERGPFTYVLQPSGIAEHGWRLEHERPVAYVGVDFAPAAEPSLEGFWPRHQFYSTSSESPWIDTFLLRQRGAHVLNELRGCVWKQWDSSGMKTRELVVQSDWLDVLATVFHERLVAYSQLEREELWRRVMRQHEEWKREVSRRGR
ncbi:hypothetical protein FHS18_003209 [Paenibacillus phyllosphaerae]|uniref:Arylamine N-acetyltransferase n=1 Tax=Paenibacillus phyllosphaerae TaxID=274593 RepID=A0A7W5AZY2_9BACL|nr:arylamine N-acetyltransferase [Paenibacillus phyllosphaerae]MBB3111141.1 hypothetical protein [Paenibacillus phyllosphaerae]